MRPFVYAKVVIWTTDFAFCGDLIGLVELVEQQAFWFYLPIKYEGILVVCYADIDILS